MQQPNQFDLMRQRRFLPLFMTQFLGAFNDNLFKNAFLVMVAFHGLSTAGLGAQTLINAAAGVFILPFFVFSALSGQLAEKFDKAVLAGWIKLLETAIMAAAGIGFATHSAGLLMGCLFMMGVHSALFGTLKYSVLPQYLKPDELLGGNGMIEMGTFVAILLGQISGTLLVSAPHGETLIIWACVGVALLGYAASRFMPAAPPSQPDLKLRFNVIGESLAIVQQFRKNRTVFYCLLGISWFWFFGSIYLTQLPALTHEVLHGDPAVYTLLMTLFSIGVGAGSLLCEKLSGRQIELGLVPLGSIGLSLFGIDLYFATLPPQPEAIYGIGAFIGHHAHWRIMADILLIGIFGGLFIVPLYALIQTRTQRELVSRAIAANNILNSIFMVIAAGMAIALLGLGMSIKGLLLTTALLNIAVAAYIYTLLPEFFMRFVVWVGTHTLYRVRKSGLDNIPAEGPCVLVCNHVSYADALIIAGSIRRPVRFVMDHRIFRIPILNLIFRTCGAIPIAPSSEDSAAKESAFKRVAQLLADGEVVAIFPEGRITSTGEINRFMPGIDRILRETPVPVVPMALQGLWGSFFSRARGPAMRKLPRGLFSKVGFRIGQAIAPDSANRKTLEAQVRALRGEWK